MLTSRVNYVLLILWLLLMFGLPHYAQAQQEDQRNLESFTKLDFEGHGTVYFKKGNENEVRIQGAGRVDLSKIRTDVIDNTLYIRYEKGSDGSSFEVLPKVHVFLTYTNLEALELAGKIKVQCSEAIQSNNLEMDLEGYITGALEVDVQHFDLTAEGYAKMKISGYAASQRIHLEGLGKIQAAELVSKEAEIEIDGSSFISLQVSDALYATVQGQAHLEFSGEPRITAIDKEEQAFVGTF